MPSPTAENYADPIWCERELNPRILVPNALDFYSQWPIWAAETRARLPHTRDLAYGDDPREIMDIFHAPEAKGAFAFIHGGYWRAFTKDDHSWVADALVPAGYSVVVINYPLCPQVTVNDIAQSCRRAIARLWRELTRPNAPASSCQAIRQAVISPPRCTRLTGRNWDFPPRRSPEGFPSRAFSNCRAC